MKFTLLAGAVLASLVEQVQSKAVFAHFMLANAENFTDATWQNNYKLAADASIDGFALNIGHDDPRYKDLIAAAFKNAAISKFKVFLNFDYAAGGFWPIDNIVPLIKQYRDHQYYYKHNSKPLVATFEGYERASDWVEIKAQAGPIFFMPQWSSVPPYAQVSVAGVDGLTSWDAWPAGNNKMYSQNDATFIGALKTVGKPYMMPVSPWFFTRMPKYDKNWAWKGDSLWYDRWTQVLHKQPEFVQIISWNDFGESHYIGPLDESQYAAFDSNHGNSPYNYARGMPHDAWRKHLPYLIAMYKDRATIINQERTVAWFRTTSLANTACNAGGTTGNAPAKLQAKYGVSQIMEDKVFFSVLLGSAATVTVTIGGVDVPVTWLNVPRSGVGLHHGSAPFNGLTGLVLVTVGRTNPTRVVMQVLGASIVPTCPQGMHNYNAWVGSKDSGITTLGKASTAITHCNAGTGWSTYQLLCGYSCQFDYCPDVCTCTLLGSQIANPPAIKTRGCPVSTLDNTYQGLCDHTCARTTCVSGICNQLSTADSNNYNNVCKPKAPVAPPPYVCRAGKGYESNTLKTWNSLCGYACKYDRCDSKICVCTDAGPASTANPVPAITTTQTFQYIYGDNKDSGLCNFACQRGSCDNVNCISTSAAANRRIAPTTPKDTSVPRRIFQGLGESEVSIVKRDTSSSHLHSHIHRRGVLHGK